MKQTFDLDSIIYGVLKSSTSLVAEISGGIYPGQRPESSDKEDIVINSIDLSQQYAPQIGTSNVNIHVADKLFKIGGKDMKIANRERLKTISGLVLSALRGAKITGLKFVVTNQNTIRESEISQHFVNLRIE